MSFFPRMRIRVGSSFLVGASGSIDFLDNKNGPIAGFSIFIYSLLTLSGPHFSIPGPGEGVGLDSNPSLFQFSWKTFLFWFMKRSTFEIENCFKFRNKNLHFQKYPKTSLEINSTHPFYHILIPNTSYVKKKNYFTGVTIFFLFVIIS